MKNTLWMLAVGIIVVIAGAIIFMNNGSGTVTGNVVGDTGGEVQKITLSEHSLNYYPNDIAVKANQPVEITLDDSVKGCLRSFTIRDLGVSKYAKTPTDTITFTPTKKGIFNFACAMGMGYGNIIVE